MSKIKTLSLAALCLTYFFSFGCSSKNTNSNSKALAPNTICFAASSSDYQTGTIYGLSLTSFKVKPVLTASGNPDFKLFLEENSSNYIAIQRWGLNSFQKASASSIISTNSLHGNELGALPRNVLNILKLKNSNYLLLGEVAGEAAVANANMLSLSQASAVIANLAEEPDTHLVGAAAANNTVFVVSGGLNKTTFTATPAKIHQLNTALTAVTTSTEIPNCKNIFGDSNNGFLQLSASSFVVSCNPQYAPSGETLAVVKVDVSTGTPVFTSIKSSTATDTINAFEVRGASADKNSIFIEETVATATPPFARTNKRYWLNIGSKIETPVTTYGGQMLYDSIFNQYIFSCLPENAGCAREQKTFVFVPVGNETSAGTKAELIFDDSFRAMPSMVFTE